MAASLTNRSKSVPLQYFANLLAGKDPELPNRNLDLRYEDVGMHAARHLSFACDLK